MWTNWLKFPIQQVRTPHGQNHEWRAQANGYLSRTFVGHLWASLFMGLLVLQADRSLLEDWAAGAHQLKFKRHVRRGHRGSGVWTLKAVQRRNTETDSEINPPEWRGDDMERCGYPNSVPNMVLCGRSALSKA